MSLFLLIIHKNIRLAVKCNLVVWRTYISYSAHIFLTIKVRITSDFNRYSLNDCVTFADGDGQHLAKLVSSLHRWIKFLGWLHLLHYLYHLIWVFFLVLSLNWVCWSVSFILLLLLFLQESVSHHSVNILEPLKDSKTRLLFIMTQEGLILVILDNVHWIFPISLLFLNSLILT